MANRTKRTAKKEEEFLDLLRTGTTVTKACKIVNIGRVTVYEWRQADEAFAKRWDEAIEIGTDSLEDEAVRRAHDGVDRPVFYQGDVCGHVREYSDTLLMFMLKGRRPEKFKDRATHEVTGPGGGPVETVVRTYELPNNGRDDQAPAGPAGAVPRDTG